jgi:hypothetical protein
MLIFPIYKPPSEFITCITDFPIIHLTSINNKLIFIADFICYIKRLVNFRSQVVYGLLEMIQPGIYFVKQKNTNGRPTRNEKSN